MQHFVEAPVSNSANGLPDIPFIYTLTNTGLLVDFGFIPIVSGLRYTTDASPWIDTEVGPTYQGATYTVQPDGSILYTGGTWIKTKTPTPPVTTPPNPSTVPATQADVNTLLALIANLQIALNAANLNASSLATSLSAANATIAKMKINKSFPVQGTSDTNGLITIDLTPYNFTVVPDVAFLPIIASPVVGTPGNHQELVSVSTTTAVLRLRKMISVLNLGVLPQYGGNAGVTSKVIIIPREPT